MSNKLDKNDLILNFKRAEEQGSEYVAVFVRLDGYEDCEMIVNTRSSMEDKLTYYINTYDDQLRHKHAKDYVKIVGLTHADRLADIEWFFLEGDFDEI